MPRLIYPWLPGETRAENEARAKLARDAETSRNRSWARMDRTEAERAAARYLFITLPKCDDCGGKDFQTQRTEASGEVTSRKVKCKGCGSNFTLILE